MINPSAVFEIKPAHKPKPVLIRIRKTQEKITAYPCSNGWHNAKGDFIHVSAARLVRVLDWE